MWDDFRNCAYIDMSALTVIPAKNKSSLERKLHGKPDIRQILIQINKLANQNCHQKSSSVCWLSHLISKGCSCNSMGKTVWWVSYHFQMMRNARFDAQFVGKMRNENVEWIMGRTKKDIETKPELCTFFQGHELFKA